MWVCVLDTLDVEWTDIGELLMAFQSCSLAVCNLAAHVSFQCKLLFKLHWLWDWDTASVSCSSNIGQSYLRPVCCVVSFLLSLNATYFKHASTSCSTTKTKPKESSNNNPFSASTIALRCTPDCTAGSCLKTNITNRFVIKKHTREEPVVQSSTFLSSVCFLLCASGCSVCKILNGFVLPS